MACLDFASINVQRLVDNVGGTPEVMHEHIQRLSVDGEWGDSLALVMVAMCLDAALVVQHTHEQLTWVVGVARPLHARGIFLCLSKDHFTVLFPNVVQPIDLTALPVTWLNWRGATDETLTAKWRSLRGGFVQVPADPTWESVTANKIHSVPECIHVGSWNVGALFTRLPEALALARDVLALQETNLTEAGQRALMDQARCAGYTLRCGVASGLRRTTRGQWRTSKRDCPGVAFLTKDSVSCSEVSPCTPSGEGLVRRGRMSVLQVRDRHASQNLFVYNVYAPSGHTDSDVRERNAFQDSLCEELLAREGRVLLVGDHNTDLRTASFVEHLRQRRWHLPPLVETCEGRIVPTKRRHGSIDMRLAHSLQDFADLDDDVYTYHSDRVFTCIDGFLCGPGVHVCPAVQVVEHTTSTQHSLVSCAVACASTTDSRYPSLAQPTRFTRRDPFAPCPIDVGHLAAQIDALLADRCIEQAWSLFSASYYRYLLATTEHVEGHPPLHPPVVRAGRAGPVNSEISSQTRLARFGKKFSRFISNSSPSSAWVNEIVAEWSALHDLLPTELQYTAWKSCDASVAKQLTEFVQKERMRERREAVKTWLQSLTDNVGRPTSQMYHWLKGSFSSFTVSVSSAGVACLTLAQTFDSLRKVWQSICHDPENAGWGEVHGLATLVVPQEAYEYDLDAMHAQFLRTKPKKATGLDNWHPSALLFMPREWLPLLVRFYAHGECTGTWPSSWTVSRVAFLPKEAAHNLDVTCFRPLAINSVFWRAWSRYHLQQSVGPLLQTLPDAMRGGISRRSGAPLITDILLRIEHSVLCPSADTEGTGVSVDAEKCFDHIRLPQALEMCRRRGFPSRVISGLAGWYMQHTRMNSFRGFVDGVQWKPMTGAVQGCSLSGAACNILVEIWVESMRLCECIPATFYDDRNLYGMRRDISEAWQASTQWDALVSWRVNAKKTVQYQFGHKASDDLLWGGKAITRAASFRLLGAQASCSYHEVQFLLKARAEATKLVCVRLERLRCDVVPKLRCLGSMCTPRLIFGPFSVMPNVTIMRSLAVRFKRAVWGRRGVSFFPIAVALLYDPRLHFPDSAAIAGHVLFRLRAVQEQPALWELFSAVHEARQKVLPRGPVGVCKRFFARLGWTWEDSEVVVTHSGVPLRWLDTAVQVWTNALTEALRLMLVRDHASTRDHLQGFGECDIIGTHSLFYQRGLRYGKWLVSLVSDGVWTRDRLTHVDFLSPACRLCGAEVVEDIRHVLYHCVPLGDARKAPGWLQVLAADLPPAAALCGWLPSADNASVECRAAWPAIVAQHCNVLELRQLLLNQTNVDNAIVDGYVDGGSTCLNGFGINFDCLCSCAFQFGHHATLSQVRGPRVIWSQPSRFKGQTSWQFPRNAWNMLCRYVSALEILPVEVDCPGVTFLELWLDFVCFYDGHRFPSMMPDVSGGGWWTQQLMEFRRALSTWCKLAQSSHQLVQRLTTHCDWAGQALLPRLELVPVRLKLVAPRRVFDLLCECREYIAQSRVTYKTSRGAEMWRRWAPGLKESQMLLAFRPAYISPLLEGPRRRLPCKSRGLAQQAFVCHVEYAHLVRVLQGVLLHASFWDYVRIYGATNSGSFRALATATRKCAERATKWSDTVFAAADHNHHVVDTVRLDSRD
eukprot:6476926-Amphidinium_carterae.2